jgi:hypothetical protein
MPDKRRNAPMMRSGSARNGVADAGAAAEKGVMLLPAKPRSAAR